MTKDVHPIVKCTPVHTSREKEPCTSHHLNYMLRKYQSWNSQMSISTQWICLCSIEFYMVNGVHYSMIIRYVICISLLFTILLENLLEKLHLMYTDYVAVSVIYFIGHFMEEKENNERIIFVFKFNSKVIDIIKNETL